MTMEVHSVPTNAVEMNLLYHKIERLDADLKKREMHLAELIDEVVYAEDQKEKAVRHAEMGRYLVTQLECVVQDMLGYVKVLESNVLLPAFLALSNVVPEDMQAKRQVISDALDRISEGDLSSRTKKLISSATALPSDTQTRAARESFMRGLTNDPVNVEDAIALSGLLLERKAELAALLEDLHERVRCLLLGGRSEWPAGGGGGAGSGRHEAERAERAEAERAEARRVEAALRSRVAQLEHEAAEAREAMQRREQEMRVERERLMTEHDEMQRREQQMRAEKDRLTAEHDAECAILQAHLAEARGQSAKLAAERGETNGRSSELDNQVATLQSANDALKSELFDLQQKMLSSPSATRAGGAQEIDAAVNGMAKELAVVEQSMADLGARFQEERKQIVSQFDDERRRFAMERQECDALIERMAVELEQLAKENKSLRASAALKEL